LESSGVALLQAASGLERLMVGSAAAGVIKDSNVAQISAFLYYQANVAAKLTSNKAFQRLFKTTIFNQIDKDFGLFIDSQARTKPKSLHHVYEWNKTGQTSSRLFKLNKIESTGLSFKINYDLKLSKSSVPTKNRKQKSRYVFANKAEVMEKGMPIIIRPKSAERLVFEIDGEAVFMPKGKSVTVRSPGGRASTNQFDLTYSRYFSGPMVSHSIKTSGFQNIFGSKFEKAMRVPSSISKVRYSFSPGTIRLQADSKLTEQFGGVA
jgi:hypothetical protein